jgi:acyl carrier protein
VTAAPSYAEVEAGVFAEIRRLLGLDERTPIRPEQMLLDELGLDSLDLVQLIYQLERRFSIEISEGTLLRVARADLPVEAIVDDIYLTPVGRERVIALLHDTPPERFPEAIHHSTVPLYATAGAFARIVHRLLAGA